jgi:nickel-dependent lactate racemase
MQVANPFGEGYAPLILPDHTHVVGMREPPVVDSPKRAIREALERPIDSGPLSVLARRKMAESQETSGRRATAVIVVSDNTRPVPYRGEQGILLPILAVLSAEGYAVSDITILIATGTHRAMSESEIAKMIDPEVLAMGIEVVNHDCTDDASLSYLGKTRKGTEIHINSRYVHADLKIATGLVESHFMAGASGGRKAICPGLIGEKSTYVFHGAPFMAHENSRDLNLDGNLVHEEAVEVATVAGIDFLVNVTLNHAFALTGIFAGDFRTAHQAAVAHITESVAVQAPVADIVITHGGFVGMNHYQCAKCAVASLGILKEGGYLIIIADTTDEGNVVGSINYRTTLALMRLFGAEAFLRLISSDAWTFIPEQWQVQMWAKVFQKIPMDHLIFYSPQMDEIWWPGLPGVNGSTLLGTLPVEKTELFGAVIEQSLEYIESREKRDVQDMQVTWISDGPYVIPMSQ